MHGFVPKGPCRVDCPQRCALLNPIANGHGDPVHISAASPERSSRLSLGWSARITAYGPATSAGHSSAGSQSSKARLHYCTTTSAAAPWTTGTCSTSHYGRCLRDLPASWMALSAVPTSSFSIGLCPTSGQILGIHGGDGGCDLARGRGLPVLFDERLAKSSRPMHSSPSRCQTRVPTHESARRVCVLAQPPPDGREV
jgi:hypothetical protein